MDLGAEEEVEQEREAQGRESRVNLNLRQEAHKKRCCLFLQYLLQSCFRGGRGIVEDVCYEIRRAEACVD
jgi:hypothetical protein